MAFIDTFKDFVKEQNLTAREIASKTNLNHLTVQNILDGKTKTLRKKTYVRLAEYYTNTKSLVEFRKQYRHDVATFIWFCILSSIAITLLFLFI